MSVDADAVLAYLRGLQDRICSAIEQADGSAKFSSDRWERAEGGGGESRVLRNGSVFEQAGVNFSHVMGSRLPPSATAQRPELADATWMATGVSLVFHPWNPYIPTTHANVRFFSATPKDGSPGTWWFGGGFDLTPYYPFEEDVPALAPNRATGVRRLRRRRLFEAQTVVRSIFLSKTSQRDPRCRRPVFRRPERMGFRALLRLSTQRRRSFPRSLSAHRRAPEGPSAWRT